MGHRPLRRDLSAVTTAGCDCVTRTASFVFDGTKYVEGKAGKDTIVKPCGAAKAR
jgi:hypothetical protein